MNQAELDALIERTRLSVDRMRKMRDETLRRLEASRDVSKGHEEDAAAMSEAIDLAEEGAKRAKEDFKP